MSKGVLPDKEFYEKVDKVLEEVMKEHTPPPKLIRLSELYPEILNQDDTIDIQAVTNRVNHQGKKVGETRIFTEDGTPIVIPVIEIESVVKETPVPKSYFKRVKRKKR